jgi:hypothetical protein
MRTSGDAGRVLHEPDCLLLDAPRVIELMAANLEGEARVLPAARESD